MSPGELEDDKGEQSREAGEREEDSGEVTEDSKLEFVPVIQPPADIEDEAKVGEVVTAALCLCLVAVTCDHLWMRLWQVRQVRVNTSETDETGEEGETDEETNT